MTNETKRNDPCPCGSGKKYKKCCASKSSWHPHSYSKIDKERSHTSIQKISGMISQTIPNTQSENLDRSSFDKNKIKLPQKNDQTPSS